MQVPVIVEVSRYKKKFRNSRWWQDWPNTSYHQKPSERIIIMNERTLPYKHVNLAPYVALVITKIFFEINKHQPLSFENKY
jgi:hypothetical protein